MSRETSGAGSSLLKDAGILVWTAGEFDPHDQLVRIVNTKWLTDEADIYSFVVNPPESSGKICRYCLALEPPDSFELQPLDPEQRSRDVLIAGMSGKSIARRKQGRVKGNIP